MFCAWIPVVSALAQADHTASQADTITTGTLTLERKAKKVFDSKDSVLVLRIDSLIMKDRSSLRFYGKKKVILQINHAEIGKRVFFSGRSGQNNASNMDIDIRFEKLGSLYIMAHGEDAKNGTPTHPNGNGGQVILRYSSDAIHPQEQQPKKDNYLHINVSAGGRHINATSDIRRIADQIRLSGPGLMGVPRGRIYSGSPGNEGTKEILSKPGKPGSWR